MDDLQAAVRYYRDDLGLEVDDSASADYASVKIPGVIHFGLWSRQAAAEATFGDRSAVDRVAPGLTIEFEVDSVPAASDALERLGLQLIHGPKTEPWGQTTARFALPSGALGGIAETPWARQIDD